MSKPTFFDFSLLRRVFSYASPYRKKFWFSVVLAIVLALITPVRPLLIQFTVNQYILKEVPRMLVLITIFQIGMIFIETAIRFFFSYTTAILGQSVVMDMRVDT